MALATTISRNDSGAVVLAFKGELDISRADEVELELDRIENENPNVLVFDLRELEFLDSTGLRIILSADSRARRHGRRVAIVPGPEKVQRVFRITLHDKRLDFVESPDEATENAESVD